MNEKLFLSFCVSLVCCFVSCAPSISFTERVSPTAQERKIAERVFSLVNAERLKLGRKPLVPVDVMNKMAQKCSEDSAEIHLSNKGRKAPSVKALAEYAALKHGIEGLGQITYHCPASQADLASAAVKAWSSRIKGYSPNIAEVWDLTGIGVRYSADGRVYLTLLVGVRNGGIPRSIQSSGWRN